MSRMTDERKGNFYKNGGLLSSSYLKNVSLLHFHSVFSLHDVLFSAQNITLVNKGLLSSKSKLTATTTLLRSPFAFMNMQYQVFLHKCAKYSEQLVILCYNNMFFSLVHAHAGFALYKAWKWFLIVLCNAPALSTLERKASISSALCTDGLWQHWKTGYMLRITYVSFFHHKGA